MKYFSRANNKRCSAYPLYGLDLIKTATITSEDKMSIRLRQFDAVPIFPDEMYARSVYSMTTLAATKAEISERMSGFMSRFQIFVPPCVVHPTYDGKRTRIFFYLMLTKDYTKNGRKPLSGGYGRRLVLRSSDVRILAPST